MLYILQDKYFVEGYYEEKAIVCGFISGSKAKDVENVLKYYLVKYDSEINSPNDYFDILKEHKEEIARKFSSILESEIEGKKLYSKLRIGRCYEWPIDWKSYGPWFQVREISEF